MHKLLICMLLTTSTFVYSSYFSQQNQEDNTLPIQEKAAQLTMDSFKTPDMLRRNLTNYLKSNENPVKITDYCRFIYKQGLICGPDQTIYARIALDGTHIRIFNAEEESAFSD